MNSLEFASSTAILSSFLRNVCMQIYTSESKEVDGVGGREGTAFPCILNVKNRAGQEIWQSWMAMPVCVMEEHKHSIMPVPKPV